MNDSAPDLAAVTVRMAQVLPRARQPVTNQAEDPVTAS